MLQAIIVLELLGGHANKQKNQQTNATESITSPTLSVEGISLLETHLQVTCQSQMWISPVDLQNELA